MSDADPFSALFHVIADSLNAPGRVLFVGATPVPGLSALGRHALLVQPLQPDETVLKAQGWQVASEIPVQDEFDHVIVMASKNHDETRYAMALGWRRLKTGGLLTTAGANDAGGKRLEKDFVTLDMVPAADSKHKSRVVQARKESAEEPSTVQAWITQGDWQPVLGGRFISRPGLFSWDRADQGSVLLAELIPPELSGCGADFGCGYGYLSAHALSSCAGVSHITALDADARAVEACRRNTKFAAGRIDCVWHDLRQVPALSNLDFIIMNPPFHEGVKTLNQLGISFIRNAAACLKPGGRLFMVANNHLPYEDVLKSSFSDVHLLDKGQGFKIIRATK